MRKIYRKGKGFTVLQNASIHDGRLSLKAIGLHAVLMSYKDGVVFSASKLARNLKDGRDSIRSALAELEELGYYERKKIRDPQGTYRWETTVYDLPRDCDVFSPWDECTEVGETIDGKSNAGNPGAISKDEAKQLLSTSNTNSSNTDQDLVPSRQKSRSTKKKSKEGTRAKEIVYSEEFENWWIEYRGFCLTVGAEAGSKKKANQEWLKILVAGEQLDFLEATSYYIQTKTAQHQSKGEATGVAHGERFIKNEKWREALDHKRGNYRKPEGAKASDDERFRRALEGV